MIEFTEIEGKPDLKTLAEIEKFYVSIFEHVEPGKFAKRISEAVNLLTILALHQNKIVGFKIGYQSAPKEFYSWVGGVDENYRNRGIAAELMRKQHLWCRKNWFKLIRTKTRNKFKSMLILNIKHGFDIIDVYSDINNELKIVLEKHLDKI